MNILLIITIAALALALSSIGVAFSFKKAYDKKREESKSMIALMNGSAGGASGVIV